MLPVSRSLSNLLSDDIIAPFCKVSGYVARDFFYICLGLKSHGLGSGEFCGLVGHGLFDWFFVDFFVWWMIGFSYGD